MRQKRLGTTESLNRDFVEDSTHRKSASCSSLLRDVFLARFVLIWNGNKFTNDKNSTYFSTVCRCHTRAPNATSFTLSSL